MKVFGLPLTAIQRVCSPFGYGHRLRAGEILPNVIDQARAERLLTADVATAEQAVTRNVEVPLTQNQFDALVDFVYNLGEGRLAGSTLLRELNQRNFGLAGQQILKWDYCGSAVSAGLHRRREAEFALWNGTPLAPELPAASTQPDEAASECHVSPPPVAQIMASGSPPHQFANL